MGCHWETFQNSLMLGLRDGHALDEREECQSMKTVAIFQMCHAAPIDREVVSIKLVKDLIQRFCGGELAENHEGQVIVD